MADMDMEIVTEVEGLAELEEAFTGGSARAIKKFLRHVEFKAAKVLVDSAEEFCPYRTGELEENIHRQTVIDNSTGTVTVRVGPSRQTFYGLVQELGAPSEKIPALHWLEDSARAVQGEVLEEYQIGLRDGLNDMKK